MTRSSRIFGRSIRWFSLGLFLVVGTVWEGGLEALGGALAPSGAVAWHPGTPDGRRALRAPVQGQSLDRAKEAAAKEEALRRLWSETAVATVGLLETQHYLKRAVDGDGSRRALERFLETLDPARMHFLESDVVEFRERYGGGLGQELKEGRFDAVEAIFGRLKERCVEVRPLVEELLEGAWDFREPWTVELSRMHAAWPKDAGERRRLWREQLGAEILNEVLDGMSVDRARGRARKRHWESGEVMLKAGLGERVAWALAGVAKAYDAHSDYLTREEFEAEDNDVRLSRVGIGITVDGDPMGVRVVGMLPGGPAERDGRLRVNDRIVAVADGTGPFQELEALPFAKAMSLLRGEKGTLVKLKVQPAREEDPARRMVIALHRDEMRSSEGEAYGKLVEWTEGGGTRRVGWIGVPGFYGSDSGGGRMRSSVARDVAALVKRMKAEGVGGVVLDLRGNLGGLLDEAIELGGVFLGKVPIAAVRASDETVEVLVPRTVKKPVYDGPLVVLLDHGSASASELLSGALQDYGRAVVVGGEQSFGKGSVQMTIPMGEYLRGKNRRNVGGLALTIGKFYRVSGQSTQLLGVRPDLVLPSTYDVPTEGEASLIDPLSHDAIASVSELPSKRMVEEATLERLRAASERRVAASEEFLQIREERDKLRKEAQENRISLQESVRRKELEEAKQRYEARQQKMGGWAKGKRFYRLQLGDVKLKRLKGEDQDPLAGTDPEWMAVEEEGIRILEDLVWGARGAAH